MDMKAKLIVGLGLLLGAVGASQADTVFTNSAGALGTAGDWSNRKPGPRNPGTVDVNGSLGNASQEKQLFSEAKVYTDRKPVMEGRMMPLNLLVSGSTQPFQLSPDDRPGSWCWFQDERVVLDNSNSDDPVLMTSTVTWAPKGDDKRGDVDMFWARLGRFLKGGELEKGHVELYDQCEMDDHASASFWIRPDGRYMAFWARHSSVGGLFYRLSDEPGNPEHWGEIMNFPDHLLCYTNPHWLEEEQSLFLGSRSIGFDSNLYRSKDRGETWAHHGRLIDQPDPWPDNADGGRAYVKYAGDKKSRIYLFSTDDHPQINFDETRTKRGEHLNSIYAAYIESNKLHRSDGTVVDEDLSDTAGTPPWELTKVFDDGTVIDGFAMRRGWQVDLHVAPDGHPFGIFQMRAGDNPEDHRYFYARFDGTKWNVHQMAYAGGQFVLHTSPDYTGLAAVDPSNPDYVYISTDAHPLTGEPLISRATGKKQHEIFMGRTRDGGNSWDWSALTENSPCNNVRPIVPEWAEGKGVVLWLRGNYGLSGFYHYDTQIMGQVFSYGPSAKDSAQEALKKRHTKTSANIDKADVEQRMRTAFDYQMRHTYAELIKKRPSLELGRGPASWASGSLFMGACKAYDATGDETYYQTTLKWSEGNRFTPIPRPTAPDDMGMCMTYVWLYDKARKPEMIEPTLASVELSQDQYADKEMCHYVDALYMTKPTWAHLIALGKKEAVPDFLEAQFIEPYDSFFDREYNLLYRDRKFIGMAEEGKPIFWGRGNGWGATALALILQALPENHDIRPAFEERLKLLADGLKRAELPHGGWSPNLGNPEKWSEPELSATTMLAFGLTYGVNAGLLSREEYLPVIERAWEVVKRMQLESGGVGYCQRGGDRPYKFERERVEYWGTGGFLLFGSELLKLR
jgi:rhamnogalacturonyl hydrolase YesR